MKEFKDFKNNNNKKCQSYVKKKLKEKKTQTNKNFIKNIQNPNTEWEFHNYFLVLLYYYQQKVVFYNQQSSHLSSPFLSYIYH